MKLKAFFLFLFAVAQARIIKNSCDGGVIVNNKKFEKEVIQTGYDSPYQLALDYDTNTLFFSYSHPDNGEAFSIAYVNLKNMENGTIEGVADGFASAVDGKSHKVYLGGKNGVYTYDFEIKKAKFEAARGTNIWQMFYKNKLYFTSYPDEIAYVYENGVTKKVPELLDTKVLVMGVDKIGNILFSNSSGLFVFKKNSHEPLMLADYTLNGISTDIHGNLFFSTPSAIYSITSDTLKITKRVEIEGIYGVAIEGDNNIIYSTEDSITRLKPTGITCDSDNNTV